MMSWLVAEAGHESRGKGFGEERGKTANVPGRRGETAFYE